MEELNELMAGMLQKIYAVQDPQTGEPIEFEPHPFRHKYRNWECDGRLFCYTPWAAKNGKYYCWTYIPHGRGSQSGNARNWRMRGLVGFKKRKTAKQRAYDRYCKFRERSH
jgi:hypothetical protein